MRKDLRDHLTFESQSHWTEFGSIIASANVFGIVVAVGLTLEADISLTLRVALILTSAASVIAVLVAYLGIRAGSPLTVAPLDLASVAAGFLVAIAQTGMVTLIAFAANRGEDPVAATGGVDLLRHWLALAGLFAFAGGFLNWTGARHRLRYPPWVHLDDEDIALRVRDYEGGQRQDRIGAWSAGGLMAIAWVVSSFWGDVWVFNAFVALYLLSMLPALASQQRGLNILWDIKRLSKIRDDGEDLWSAR